MLLYYLKSFKMVIGYKILNKVKLYDNKLFINNNLNITSSSNNLNDFLKEIYKTKSFSYTKFYKMDKLCKLGYISSELLLMNMNEAVKTDENMALIIFNKNSTIDTDIDFYKSFDGFPSPAVFVYTLPNILIGEISIRFGFKGENRLYITNNFNYDLMKSTVMDLNEFNNIKRVICGFIDVDYNKNYLSELYLLSGIEEKENNYICNENF